jgi:hypothetical protein
MMIVDCRPCDSEPLAGLVSDRVRSIHDDVEHGLLISRKWHVTGGSSPQKEAFGLPEFMRASPIFARRKARARGA